MSVQDSAAQLAGMPDDFPYNAQQAVTNYFEQCGSRIQGILGQGHASNSPLQELINEVMTRSSDTYSAMELLQSTMRETAQKLMAGG